MGRVEGDEIENGLRVIGERRRFALAELSATGAEIGLQAEAGLNAGLTMGRVAELIDVSPSSLDSLLALARRPR